MQERIDQAQSENHLRQSMKTTRPNKQIEEKNKIRMENKERSSCSPREEDGARETVTGENGRPRQVWATSRQTNHSLALGSVDSFPPRNSRRH